MKKILAFLMILFLMTGCGDMMNTPTKQVEKLFSKYQKVDDDINRELDTMLITENMSDANRTDYKDIISNQYKNLTYTIKDEKVNGDTAIVTAEIEVTDYKAVITKLDNDYSTKTDYTTDDYEKEKLKRLKDAKDKVKYTLEVSVIKDSDGNWKISNLADTDIKKIQGMY